MEDAKMDPSKVWINRDVHSKQKIGRKKNTKKTSRRNTSEVEQINTNKAKVGTSVQGNHKAGSNNLSFLENLTKLTQELDLVKLKGQISELNQVFEQVNGVINQISQFQRPPQIPIRGNVGRQSVHPNISNHLYHGYRTENSYYQRYPHHYKGH
jgi:hypothetical protein